MYYSDRLRSNEPMLNVYSLGGTIRLLMYVHVLTFLKEFKRCHSFYNGVLCLSCVWDMRTIAWIQGDALRI